MAEAAENMEQWQQGPALEFLQFSGRQFEPDDYPLAALWWKQHDWPAVPVESLPRIGLMVEVDMGSEEGLQPVCCSFMYWDSGWGYIAWTVADAEAPKAIRSAAVDFAIATLTKLGDELGITLLYTSTRNPAMQERYTRLGWTPCEQDFQTFIRPRPLPKEEE